jgi:cytidylate kinase
MTRRITVAIDGPVGAGKSTVAKRLAKELGYALVDSGAMYRCVALLALEQNISLEEESKVVPFAVDLPISFQFNGDENTVWLSSRDVSAEIRTPEVSRGASLVSRIPAVREALFGLQRRLSSGGGVVMEGRDIGTVICPNAEVKFFLTASVEARAQRRYDELLGTGHRVSLDETKREVEARDHADINRPISPLKQASDAILVDASTRNIDDIVSEMTNIVRRKEGQ